MRTWLHVPLLAWAAAALVLAVVWGFVWPADQAASGIAWVILRWFHALTWLLLALAALIAALAPAGWSSAKPVAFAALITYLIFLGAIVLT